MIDEIIRIKDIRPQIDCRMSDGLADLLTGIVKDIKYLNKEIQELKAERTREQNVISEHTRYGL